MSHQIGLNREMAERWYDAAVLDRLETQYGTINDLDNPGEFTYDHNNHVLYVWLPNNEDPNQHEFRAPFIPLRNHELYEEGAMGMWFRSGNQYLIFRGLTFRGTAGDPIFLRWSDHILLEDLDLSYSSGQLRCEGDDYTVLNCHLHHGNYNGIQVFSDEGISGFRFLKNHVHHFGDPATWGHHHLGAESWGVNLAGTDRAIIYGNYFHHNHQGSNRMDGGAIVHETWGKDYPLRAARRTIFEYNVFSDNCEDLHFQGKKQTRLQGSVVRNNLFYNSKHRAIVFWGDNQKHIVHNNTFYNSREGGILMYRSDGLVPTGNKVFDNRMLKSGDSYDLLIRAAEGNTVLNNRFENGTYSLEELMRESDLSRPLAPVHLTPKRGSTGER